MKGRGHAKPGRTVTKKVTRGPNKGDTVRFVANRRGTQHPGKLVPRLVVKDVGPKNTSTVPKKNKKQSSRTRITRQDIMNFGSKKT